MRFIGGPLHGQPYPLKEQDEEKREREEYKVAGVTAPPGHPRGGYRHVVIYEKGGDGWLYVRTEARWRDGDGEHREVV